MRKLNRLFLLHRVVQSLQYIEKVKTNRVRNKSQAENQDEDLDNESVNSRVTQDFEGDPVENNLQGVEESLNDLKNIMQSNNSFVKYTDVHRKSLCDKIPLQKLLEWQQVLKETSPKEIESASMEYKNELLNLASLISDVLSPE